MNLRAVESDEAVRAAVPVAHIEAKPAVVGKGSKQVTYWKDRRYSRTHECNLPRLARAAPAIGGTRSRVRVGSRCARELPGESRSRARRRSWADSSGLIIMADPVPHAAHGCARFPVGR